MIFAGVIGGSPPSARYWRVYITSIGSGQVAGINQLELYESEFGQNVATNTSSGYADSEYSVNDVATSAFNGLAYDGVNTFNCWASADTALPHWLAYDFGVSNEKTIRSIGIISRRPGSFLDQMPVGFDVQYSHDNSTWYTYWSESGVSWSADGRELKRFTHPSEAASYSGSPHGSHQYWRISILDVETATTASAIGEVEMRATPSGADQCSGGAASADAVFGAGLEADKAFDNSTTTLWSSTGKGNYNYAWLEYDFGSNVSVAEFTIRSRHDGFAYTTPERFYIQYSDDGTAWTTAWGPSVQTGWTTSETRTFSDPDYI